MRQYARYFYFFICAFYSFVLSAQNSTILGQIVDVTDSSPMIGVGVLLSDMKDSTQRAGTATDLEGKFQIRVSPGTYRIKITYLGYKERTQTLEVGLEQKNLGTIALEQEAIALKDVIVEGRQVRSVQKGDTTEYNANAFKTNPDATVQDLITKMPGIIIENGTVKAQGETIQKVTVDGKDFFGDDATMALKNLPAEVVDKIQVYNRLSDQAQFTGVDDGNSQKSINIITKNGMSNGQFGKIYTGYGTEERYQVGGNVNIFQGTRRFSLICLANNVNQQNFGSQDLLGVTSGNPGGNRGGTGGRTESSGGGSGNQGGNSSNNFMTPQQGGINTTQSLGLNYSDSWGKKLTLTGSYFFNRTTNTTSKGLSREYFIPERSNQFYDQLGKGENQNLNHRFNLRLEYKVDSSNTFLFTPRISFQNNTSRSSQSGTTQSAGDTLLNSSLNQNDGSNQGFSINNNLLFRHKFAKARRTFSANVTTGITNKTGINSLLAINQYYQNGEDSSRTLDQRASSNGAGYTLSTNLVYSEPVGNKGAFQLSYNPSYSKNNAEKITTNKDVTASEYTSLDTLLSNRYDNTITIQRGGIRYVQNDTKHQYAIGLDGQEAVLDGQQNFPRTFSTSKTFANILPNAVYTYRMSKTSNFRLNYRTQTDIPSINQLQNVVDNSNPLQLSAGNPNLRQEYSHSLTARVRLTYPEKAKALYAFLSSTYTQDYIGYSTLIPTSTILLENGFQLNEGSQLTRPTNLQGYWNSNALGTYTFPVDFIKSNLNLNAGIAFVKTPSQINQEINFASTLTENFGFALGSNISEKIDFTLSATGFYTHLKNSIQPQLNSNYYNQVSSAKVNLMPWKGLVINSEWNHTLYTGLGQGYDINFVLWNTGIGYKFLKKQAAELRVTVFDLLNQNKSVARNVAGNYVENTRTQVITRYFMLTFTYNFRHFLTINPSELP